jgi:putative membrane protein
LSLLRAFAANWIEGARAPLEDLLDQIGINVSVKVSLLAFGRGNNIKSMIVVPNFHPGPFKNLGSSNIPYIIQKMLEDRLGIIAGVPHGTSGHDMDLTSKKQCDKVTKGILNVAEKLSNCLTKASKIVRKRVASAEATCQIIGECAFITLTLSPYGMEDIPKEVGIRIVEKGLSIGLKNVVVVDSHNSIGKTGEKAWLSKQDLEYLESAALKAVKFALLESYESYQIGVARKVPSEFNIDDGIGLGGIVAFTLKIGEYKNFYVIIDGNNMVKGLREEIIEEVKKLGFHDGEVITTDTHLMSAIPLTRRGYYPVGETIPHQLLISYIKNTVIEANKEMRKSDFSCRVVEIDEVRVIGEKNLLNLSLLIDSTMKYVKILVPLIFLPATIVSLIPFFIL